MQKQWHRNLDRLAEKRLSLLSLLFLYFLVCIWIAFPQRQFSAYLLFCHKQLLDPEAFRSISNVLIIWDFTTLVTTSTYSRRLKFLFIVLEVSVREEQGSTGEKRSSKQLREVHDPRKNRERWAKSEWLAKKWGQGGGGRERNNRQTLNCMKRVRRGKKQVLGNGKRQTHWTGIWELYERTG